MVSTPCGALCRGVHLVLRRAFLWPFWGVLASVQRGQPEGARGQYVGRSPYSLFVPYPTRPSLSSALYPRRLVSVAHIMQNAGPPGDSSQRLEGEKIHQRIQPPLPPRLTPVLCGCLLEFHPPAAPLLQLLLFLQVLAMTFPPPAPQPRVITVPTEASPSTSVSSALLTPLHNLITELFSVGL